MPRHPLDKMIRHNYFEDYFEHGVPANTVNQWVDVHVIFSLGCFVSSQRIALTATWEKADTDKVTHPTV